MDARLNHTDSSFRSKVFTQLPTQILVAASLQGLHLQEETLVEEKQPAKPALPSSKVVQIQALGMGTERFKSVTSKQKITE